MTATFEKNTEHVLPIYGLYADYNNEVVITLENGESHTVYIQTEARPEKYFYQLT